MLRRLILASVLALCALPALAVTFTNAQLLILKAAIAAETDPTFVAARNANDKVTMAAFYNATPLVQFTVWKSSVALPLVGKSFNGTELAGLTTGNQQRLQTIGVYFEQGVDPSRADVRQMFDDIFSGAGGVTTRANLLVLWKRAATRLEKLYATGTGTDLSPATLVLEGLVTSSQIGDALEAQ